MRISLSLLLILATMLHFAVPSKVGDQVSLALTIYNDDYAMVKDVRTITFDQAESQVSFTDVASTIITETVLFKPRKPTDATNNIQVFEQNFENNLVDKYAILKNYLEQPISIDVNNGQSLRSVNGKLLSYTNGFILQTGNGVSIFDGASAVHVKNISDDLLIKPTLVWRVFSPIQTKADFEVAYRASGFSWKADYLLELNEEETRATFMGWVTIDNRSGKKYKNVFIKLIAGDVQTVRPTPSYSNMMPRMEAMATFAVAADAPSFSEKSFSDYHMYTLSQKVNLNESSRKQIQFIRPAYNVSVDKYYSIQVSTGGYGQQKLTFNSFVKFVNAKDNRLGIPLPKGIIRVFKSDKDDDSLEFVGEDNINHTPRDENVTVRTGSAFDVAGKLTVLKRQDINEDVKNPDGSTYQRYKGYDASMELEVRNRGDIKRSFKLELNNGYGDNNKIQPIGSSIAWQRESANKFKLQFSLAANETKTISWSETYRT